MISSPTRLVLLSLALSGLLLHDCEGVCERTDEFKAAVVIEHDLTNGDSLGSTELEMLGDAFAKTLDRVNDEQFGWNFCDKTHGRYAKHVVVQPRGKYFAHIEAPNNLGRQDFLYIIKGGCDEGCPDFQLFANDPSSSTRDLRGFFKKSTRTSSTSTCTCPDSKADRSATEEEFLIEFKRTITKFISRGRLNHIKTANEVSEVKAFACSDQELEFTQEVWLDFEADVAPEDEDGVGFAYVDSYNIVAKHYCDANGSYHTVDAILEPETEVRLRGRRLAKRLVKSTGRGRKKKEAGTGNEGSRNLLEPDQDDLTYGETCYCPIRPVGLGRPTDEDIVKSYNAVLAFEKFFGTVDRTYRVRDLESTKRKRKRDGNNR